MKKFNLDFFKIYEDLESLNTVLDNLGTQKKIVYTYGVWDLFHPGHSILLSRARELGDFLIVGTVSDKPVRKLKGEDRPVQSQNDRIVTVSSLRFVDAAVFQSEYDPSDILQSLSRVDVLTKGDDWDYIPGTETIERLGGRLILLPYSPSFSTSKLVEKVKSNNKK